MIHCNFISCHCFSSPSDFTAILLRDAAGLRKTLDVPSAAYSTSHKYHRDTSGPESLTRTRPREDYVFLSAARSPPPRFPAPYPAIDWIKVGQLNIWWLVSPPLITAVSDPFRISNFKSTLSPHSLPVSELLTMARHPSHYLGDTSSPSTQPSSAHMFSHTAVIYAQQFGGS